MRMGTPYLIGAILLFGFTEASFAQLPNLPELNPGSYEDPQAALSVEKWDEVDKSVEKALAWLASQQQPDGSFATLPTGQPGVTSLVVMAFMAQGEVPDEGIYGKQLARAIDFVTRCQKDNGLLSLVGPLGLIDPGSNYEWTGIPASYNHAISSLMLSESYGMHGSRNSAKRRQILELALKLTLSIQDSPKREIDKGGWRYVCHWDEAESDLSITGWYLMSLRSARNAGFDIADEPIDEAMAYVLKCYDKQAQTFSYTLEPPGRPYSRAMSGAGILALAHGGRHESVEARSAGDWLLRYRFRTYNDVMGEKDSYHYGTFYSCQAMYQLGGQYWKVYYPTAVAQLLAGQEANGSWSVDSNYNEANYGQCYTTALSVLALSVSNELLPIFQR